jgi:hypothetical protein
MTGPSRLAAIQTGLAEGRSRRAIAKQLGISDKTVRTELLRSADSTPEAADPAQVSALSVLAIYADAPQVGFSSVIPTRTTGSLLPPAATFVDFIPPGPARVVPTPTMTERLFQGGSVHPGKAWISCPGCHHPAWRDSPGVDAWTCGCPVGPHGCHGPTQIPDAAGVGQIAWAPYRIRPWPAPPDPAA